MREQIVMLVIKKCFNNIVGGLENDLEDGFITELPNEATLKNMIYDDVMKTKELNSQNGHMKVEKDIRFLGTEKIKAMIDTHYRKGIKKS